MTETGRPCTLTLLRLRVYSRLDVQMRRCSSSPAPIRSRGSSMSGHRSIVKSTMRHLPFVISLSVAAFAQAPAFGAAPAAPRSVVRRLDRHRPDGRHQLRRQRLHRRRLQRRRRHLGRGRARDRRGRRRSVAGRLSPHRCECRPPGNLQARREWRDRSHLRRGRQDRRGDRRQSDSRRRARQWSFLHRRHPLHR